MSLLFRGKDHSDVLDGPALSPGDQVTVVAWIKPTTSLDNSFQDQDFILLSGSSTTRRLRGRIGYSDNRMRFEAQTSGNPGRWRTDTTFGTPIVFDAWQSVAIAYDFSTPSTKPIMYREASAVAVIEAEAPTGSVRSDGQPVHVGNNETPGSGGLGFEGRLAHVAIWNRILSSSEITTVQDKGPLGVTSGLVVYYAGIVAAAPVKDYSGNGHDGTLSGAVYSSDDPTIANLLFPKDRALRLPLPLESAGLTVRSLQLPLPLESAGWLRGHLPLPLESRGWLRRALPLPLESAGRNPAALTALLDVLTPTRSPLVVELDVVEGFAPLEPLVVHMDVVEGIHDALVVTLDVVTEALRNARLSEDAQAPVVTVA